MSTDSCRRIQKLLVRDTCWLYLGDIITIHLCHGRLLDGRQTGDNFVADIRNMLTATSGYKWIQLVSGNMCPAWCILGIRAKTSSNTTCIDVVLVREMTSVTFCDMCHAQYKWNNMRMSKLFVFLFYQVICWQNVIMYSWLNSIVSYSSNRRPPLWLLC